MIRRKDIMFLFGIMMCFFSSHNTLSQSKDNDLQLNYKTILLSSNTFNKEYRYITTYNVNALGIQKNNNNWEICYGEGVFANYFDDFRSITTIKQKIMLCWKNFRDIFLNKSIYKPYSIFYFRDVLMCLLKIFFTNDIEYLLYCFGNYKILYQSSIVGMTYTYNLYNAFFNKTDIQSLYKNKDKNIEDDKKTVNESQALCCLCNKPVYEIKKIVKEAMFSTLRAVNDNTKKKKNSEENSQTENISLNKMVFKEQNSCEVVNSAGIKIFPCCCNCFHDQCVENYHKKRIRCANCNRKVGYNNNEYGYDMFLTLFLFKKQITFEYSDINKIFFIMPFIRVSFIFLPTIYSEPILYFYNYTIVFYDLLNIFQKTTLGINLSCKIEIGFSYLNKHFFSFHIKPTLSLLKELFFDKKKYNPFSIIFGIEYFVNGKGTNSRI